MMIDLLSPRGFMFEAAVVATVMFGGLLGHYWRRASWPWRLLGISFAGFLIYTTIGQRKAYGLDVPVDWVAHLGMTFYCALILSMWFIRRKERSTLREG